jgi:hypothetical protein
MYLKILGKENIMLRHHCNFTYHQIKDFYRLNGKSYDHATAIHSLKAFETHRRYNRNLDKYFDLVLLRLRNKSKLRKALINHIIDYTKEKDLKKLLRIVDTLPLNDIDGNKPTKEKADTFV